MQNTSKWIAAVLTVFLVTVFAGTGWACSLAFQQELMIDSTAQPVEFGEFSVSVDSITRGDDTGSSCDDTAWVILRFEGELDPKVGYRIELVDGEAPNFLGVSEAPLLLSEDTIMIVWSEEVSKEQPPLDFTLGITPIGPEGSAGEMQEIVVTHGGIEVGCSSTGTRDVSLLALLLFGAFLLKRSRI